MKRFKLCPYCGTKNEPVLFECIQCASDLTGVKITDDETEKARLNQEQLAGNTNLIRLCDCGTKNVSNARKCVSCGEDISDIVPTPDCEITTTFVLSSLDGNYAFRLEADETVIGRENAMQDYLKDKTYVSRVQCKLSIECGTLCIENLSATNFTFVNNQKISQKEKLADGDEIGLGGVNKNGERQDLAAYFLVRIGTCI